jgi:hypothetical protein
MLADLEEAVAKHRGRDVTALGELIWRDLNIRLARRGDFQLRDHLVGAPANSHKRVIRVCAF